MSSSFRRRPRPSPSTSRTGLGATPSSSGSGVASIPGVSSAVLQGTKPWTGGVTLTSVGLRDLDSILGGGQPLGTCILLEQDRWTPDLAMGLCRYWCAEAVSHEQILLIPIVTNHTDDDDQNNMPMSTSSPPSLHVDNIDDTEFGLHSHISRYAVEVLLSSLPRNLHWDKKSSSGSSTTDTAKQTDELQQPPQRLPLEILEEEEGDDEPEEDAEAGLQIAWQYRQDVQKERSGHSVKSGSTSGSSSSRDIYCHSYDLSGRMNEQAPKDGSSVHIVNVPCGEGYTHTQSRQCGIRMYKQILNHLKQHIGPHPNKVVRLLLHNATAATASVALPLLLTYIRSHKLPVVVMITVQPWNCRSTRKSLVNLRRASDVVLQTQGFASRQEYPPPPEFRHLHGLLVLPKVSVVTAATANGGGHFADLTTRNRPPAHVYGLKRDRRKLHIPLLHIPPEDYAGGGSVGGGGVRSGAGRPQPKKETSSASSNKTSSTGCGTGTSSLLDF
mmetsp:Transcript_23200/g.35791  ORF Transcript_23200/g.35791 Transcript_23200/m.35791 type:complete len:499 (+) Transcript_23200:167-1663(+)